MNVTATMESKDSTGNTWRFYAQSADDTDANLETISRLAGDAANRGALLVVFPEYSSFFVAAVPWLSIGFL